MWMYICLEWLLQIKGISILSMHGIPKGTEKTKSFGMYGIRQSRENETVNGMWNIYFPL